MKTKSIILFMSISALIMLSLSSCKKSAVELNISAAASLKDCMNDIEQLFVAKNPNTTLLFNFGASGALQQQIEQGAPTDIFISAGAKQMNELETKDLLLADIKSDLLKNQVVLIASKNIEISDFSDLETDEIKKIAMGEPSSVPVGQYTEEILSYYNLTDKIQDKIVYAKDVREVLTWVETQNCQAGFVYKTDALISESVKIIKEAPSDSHSPVTYPIGIIKSTKNEKISKEFVEFLKTDEVKEIFLKYGFEV